MNRISFLVLSLLALAACDDAVRPNGRAQPVLPRPSLTTAAGVTIAELGVLAGYSDVLALGINDLGWVAGVHELPISAATLWAPTGEPQPLPALGGIGQTIARDINNQGNVVGFSVNIAGGRAVLWTEASEVRDLGVLPGHNQSLAFAINDEGEVTGRSSSPDVTRAFRWSAAGGMQDLGVLSGYAQSLAISINNLGQVVGYSYNDERSDKRAFLWTAEGGMQDLGTLPGHSQSEAWDINDQGQVIGVSYGGNYLERRAFLWTASAGMRDLGTLGGAWSSAYGINNQGQVVGSSSLPSGDNHAFLWTAAGGMQDLGTLPGESSSAAYDINNQGQVAGTSWTASTVTSQRPVVWTLGTRLPVAIDIKPGDATNSINLTDQGHAKIPVAVLSTPAFDARLVVPASVQLGETTVSARRNGSLFASLADIDGDGDLDLVVHFDRALLVANGDLTSATTELTLIADLTDGRQIQGRDAVRIVP